MRKFFVGCNIHFEEELAAELQEIWPFLIGLDARPHAEPLRIVEVVPGGVLLEAPLHLGLQINFFSKLANRILLRVKEARVRDFPKLFQMMKELRKDPFLQGLVLQAEVSAKESRLNNEKRIEEIFREIFGDHPEAEQTLYIRMSQDLCSISLDCSGTHLHKRSQRTSQGEAPLRETLAAFVLRKMIGPRSAAELQDVTLIDPMCGTGTLLREGALLFQPSMRQDFSFLQWSQTPKLLKSEGLRGNYPRLPFLFRSLKAFDRDSDSVARAQASLSEIPGQITGGRENHPQPIHFTAQKEDLFQANPHSRDSTGPVWVISNPPYGERLKAEFTVPELITQISRIHNPDRLGLLMGENQARTLKQAQLPASLKLQEQWPFQNGGLRVVFSIFEKT
jgi:putative N6-adenine-specific DNA methylase